jgi:hypothetical protein
MSKEQLEYLKHIRDESLYILSVTSEGITKEEFLNDEFNWLQLSQSLKRIFEIDARRSFIKQIPENFQE